ncbi:MAG: endonuclease/exonuclease/phosphatase family protein [Treponema sp.]|nr:endonuclease/exonuclease/phosphatase family protein [Treponema sp.]
MKCGKKSLCLLFFAFFSIFVFADEITLLSFNIAHNSAYKKEHRDEWISQISEIIHDNSADIVLLQEVPIELKRGFIKKLYGDVELHFKTPEKRTILNELSEKIGQGWAFCSTAEYLLHDGVNIDGVSISGGDMSQNNAVFYDSNRFSVEDLADELGFTDFPNGDYLFNKNSVQVLRFTEIDTGKSFIIVNVHLQSKNSIEKRNADLENLSDMLLNEFGGELTDEPIAVGGDFNTKRVEFDDVGFLMYFIDGKSSPKTTLSTSAEKFKYANDFDHFVYNQAMKSILTKDMSRAKLGDSGTNLEKVKTVVIFGKKFKSSKELRERLSDHVPIIMSFDFDRAR